MAPLQTENWSPFALHRLFVQRITSHGHKKKYMLINYDRIKPKWRLNHSFWSLLIWPHPARFEICLVTWPHCHVIVIWHCHCGCLDTKWWSRDKQFKCTLKQNKLLVKKPEVDGNMKAGIVPHEDIDSRNNRIKIKTTEWGILFNRNPRRNHQGRNPSSLGLRVSSWWFLWGFGLNRIHHSGFFNYCPTKQSGHITNP